MWIRSLFLEKQSYITQSQHRKHLLSENLSILLCRNLTLSSWTCRDWLKVKWLPWGEPGPLFPLPDSSSQSTDSDQSISHSDGSLSHSQPGGGASPGGVMLRRNTSLFKTRGVISKVLNTSEVSLMTMIVILRVSSST